MNKHIDQERYLTECRDNAARWRIYKRRLTREERACRKQRIVYLLCVVLWAVFITWLLFWGVPRSKGVDVSTTSEPAVVVRTIPEITTVVGGDVPATEYAAIPAKAVEMTVKSTAYCPCPQCCGKWSGGPTASGVMPEQGRTIAVDPSVIPMGSTVVYNGHEYTAEDTGSAIKGNRIDIFYDSHQDALDWGVQEITIYVLEEN